MRCELNRRNIATARQRITCPNRSEKLAVEIFRIVFAETARGVRQDRQRMNQALLQGERVNERF